MEKFLQLLLYRQVEVWMVNIGECAKSRQLQHSSGGWNGRSVPSNNVDSLGHVARMGEERGVCRVLVGKPGGRRPLGRPRHRWADNIRMDLQEVGCGYMDWIGLAQDRDRWRTLVSAVMNFRVPWNAGNFLTSCKPVSFSRRTLHRGVSK